MKNKVYIIFCLIICLKTFLKCTKIYYGNGVTINYGEASSLFSCPNDNWLKIGTYCFLPSFSKLSWEEASFTCMQSHLFYSNLLTTTETSIIQSLFSNINQNTQNDFWDNWQILGDDLNLTAKLSNKYLTLNKSSFLWLPTTNIEDEKLKLLDSYKYVKSKTLCTSIIKNNLTKENIYYKLNDCLDKKSFICETFACFKDEFRCKDNSKCLPQFFRCNGYPDCPDNSDENDCTCSTNNVMIYDHNHKNGYITSPIKNISNDNIQNCKWEIIQEEDEIIELTFLTINLKNDEILTISQLNDEVYHITQNITTTLENTWKSKSNIVNLTYHRNVLNQGNFKIFYKTLTLNDDVSYLNSNDGNIYFYKIDFLTNDTFKHKWIINRNGNELMTLTITNMLYDPKTSFKIYFGNNTLSSELFSLEPKFLTTSLVTSEQKIEIDAITIGQRNVTLGFEGFYNNTCSRILHNQKDYGQIFSPDFYEEPSSKDITYDCSWIIKPPCGKSSNGCSISIIPTIKNFSKDCFVKFSTFNENFQLNKLESFQKIYTFNLKSNDNEILIQMGGSRNNFKVKLTYSINCFLPNNLNDLLIDNILYNLNNNKNVYSPSTKIFFKCPSGRILRPRQSSTITCLNGGVWSSKIPKCIEFFCPLPFIENGYIKNVEGYGLRSNLTFGCNIGYTSTNKIYTSICNEKQYFYPKPECKKIKCFSSNNKTSYNVLDVKKNTCPYGFRISLGSDKSQCGLDGKWHYTSYNCEEIKCFQEIINFSSINKPKLYKINDSMEIRCINGFEKNYNGNVICNEYGEWINEEGKIIDNMECIKNSIIQNEYKLNDDCKNNGTCIFEDGLLKCLCKDDFYTSNCQYKNCNENNLKGCLGDKSFRRYPNLCQNNSCQNNGGCKLINNKNCYCKCENNLIGKNCDKEYDVCKVVGSGKGYCNGHGKCIIKNKKPFCECMFLWKGKHCEIPVDICERNNNYCLNGGKCLSSIGSSYPTCKCQKMYFGSRCEEKIDYCQFKPCFHGGTCKLDNVNGYECLCTPSFMGKSCHINKDICSNDPCQNGGICVSQNETSYTCVCSNQYTGPNCSQFINLCLEYEKKGVKYCSNDGVCHSIRGENILCECRDDYSGDKCQHKTNKNEKNYNLFFTPTKFYDFDYYSQYNKTTEISNGDNTQQLIFSHIFRSSFLNETTICGWIKPDENDKDDISFIIVGIYDGNSIKKSIIDFKLTGVSLNYDKKTVTINYKLIQNQWQHFCLRSPKLHKYQSTSWDFFYNGVLIKSADKGIEPLKIKEKYLRMLLGTSLDLKSKYQGEMSLIEYYSNLLSDSEIFNLATRCSYTGSRPPIVSWLDFSDSTKTNGLVVKIEPGLCSNEEDNFSNDTLNLLRDEASYTSNNISNIDYSVSIKKCPKDIYKHTDSDGAIVEWKPNTAKEIFNDYLKLKKLYVNFESGGYFKIGIFKIMYIGTNNYNVSGICQFTVHVLKNGNKN